MGSFRKTIVLLSPVVSFFISLNSLYGAKQKEVERAKALQSQGEADLNKASYTQAVANSAECAEIYKRIKDAAGEASCRTIMGRAQASQGHYADAASSYDRALLIARENKMPEARVALLNNAGNVAYFLGHYDDAFHHYSEAEALLAPFRAEPWFARRRSVTLANLAALYQRLGQYEKALRAYQQIRALPGKLQASEQGQVLENSGTLFRRLGDPYKAIQLYGDARELFESAHDTAGEISISKNTGIALALGLKRYRDAKPLFEKAFALASKSANGREVAQAELYQAETLRLSGDAPAAKALFKQTLLVTRRIADSEDEWKALYGLGQIAEEAAQEGPALELYRQAIQRIENIRAGSGPPALRTGFLADKRDVYDSAIRLLLKHQPVSVPHVFRLLEQAKARSFQDFLPGGAGQIDISAIQAKLPVGTTVLDYWSSQNQLAVVWVNRSGWGLTQSWTQDRALWTELSRRVSQNEAHGWRKLANQVSRGILPFEKLDAKRLIVIPDGELQSVPFDLLSVPGSGDRRLLIEDYEVSYLPTATLLPAFQRAASKWTAPWHTVFVGFADPQPGAQGPEGALYPADRHDSLSSSAGEIESAARLLGGRAQLNTGAQNLKQRFLNRSVHSVPVLHLATHAVADMDDPDRSRILFSPAAPDAPAEYVFAREIYALDLRGVSLVVLSACDTELGVSFRGEGVQSFSRALLAAGAAASITTLWRVGDVTGKAFSDRFYAHLAKGKTAAGALRAAKLEFYRSDGPLAQPFYWSVYALNGDPGVTVPRTIRWTALVAVLFLVAALAATVLMQTRRQYRPIGRH